MNNFPSFPSEKDDLEWMKIALKLAEKAFTQNEIPVGSVIVKENRIIGRGYNQKERLTDPTAHAEIISISAASSTMNDWRLNGATIYVSKEPCSMCAGAIINSRISRLVFGAYDDQKGCCGSLYQICGDKRLGSNTVVKGGVLEDRCSEILSEFFHLKRKKIIKEY
ncbi:MAG: tRNA adenosine(34) deaminase TadA [Candidatus Neomarinimicrobiota bacterium]